jgi:hypothetical protein
VPSRSPRTQSTMPAWNTSIFDIITYENGLTTVTSLWTISPQLTTSWTFLLKRWARLCTTAFVFFSAFVRGRVSSQGEYWRWLITWTAYTWTSWISYYFHYSYFITDISNLQTPISLRTSIPL